MSKYSPELQQQIYDMAKANKTTAEIAEATGKRYQSIRSALLSKWFEAMNDDDDVVTEVEAEEATEPTETTPTDVVTEAEDYELEQDDDEVEEEVEELVDEVIDEVEVIEEVIEEVLEDEDEDEDEEEMVWYDEDDEPGTTPPF